MLSKYSLLCLIGILICLIAGTVARVAIIEGNKAAVNQFPYLVSVQKHGKGHICGGGVIGDRFILTAAHCVVKDNGKFDVNRLFVIAGTNDLNDMKSPAMIVRVKKVYIPRMYIALVTRAIGDIAVLRLESPLRLSKQIKRLDPPSQDTYAGVTANLAGFGWDWINNNGTHEDGGYTDSHLRFAEADVLTKNQCMEAFEVRKMPDQFLCARVKQPDARKMYGACFGDSGGVLVDGYTAIGVLSHGPKGCTERRRPSIYVTISRYLSFIENAMKDRPLPSIRMCDVKH